MRAFAAAIGLLAACKDPPPKQEPEQPRPATGATPAAIDAATPPIPGWPELAGQVLAEPVWLLDLEPRLERPEYAAHPPLTVGERVIVAGSRLGYLGLDRATGEIAWRRPAGPRLSAPLALATDDVLVIRDCDEPVGAPRGQAVLACFERIDPQNVAARAAGRLFAPEPDVGDCTAAPGGAWFVEGHDPQALTVGRRLCRFHAELAGGAAERLPDDPGPGIPGDQIDIVLRERAPDGLPWHHDVSTGAHRVVRGIGTRRGIDLPGLTVLAAAPLDGRADAGAVVVRVDTTLRRDYVAAFDHTGIRWVWPLPPPPDGDGRGGPVGISSTDRDVLVLFDGSRLARLSSSFSPPP